MTCCETYFIEELLYADEESLENCQELELVVCTLRPGISQEESFESVIDSGSSSTNLDVKGKVTGCEIKSNMCLSISGSSLLWDIISQENSFILDIDMDFFSTQNPFKLLYTEVSTLDCDIRE